MLLKINRPASDFLIEFSRNQDMPGDHEPCRSDQHVQEQLIGPRNGLAQSPKRPPQVHVSDNENHYPESVQPVFLYAMSYLQQVPYAGKKLINPTPRMIEIITER